MLHLLAPLSDGFTSLVSWEEGNLWLCPNTDVLAFSCSVVVYRGPVLKG